MNFLWFLLILFSSSGSFDYSKEPDNPFIVVEGVNSTRVKLQWEFSLTSSESVAIITVSVGKPGEQSVFIGGKSGPNGVYKVEDVMKDKYELEEPATLVIKTVTRNEDGNRYIFRVFLQGEFNPRESSASLEVFGKYSTHFMKTNWGLLSLLSVNNTVLKVVASISVDYQTMLS